MEDEPRSSVLIVCRPFKPNAAIRAFSANFFFVDPDYPFFEGLREVSAAYQYVFIEQCLAARLSERLDQLQRPVAVVPDFVEPIARKTVRPAFLVSNDTHANFLMPI